MTTQTHALPDLDEALDFELPCSVGEHPLDPMPRCYDVASWAGVLTCCGEMARWCEPHFQRLLLVEPRPDGWTCVYCNAHLPLPTAHRNYASIERIR